MNLTRLVEQECAGRTIAASRLPFLHCLGCRFSGFDGEYPRFGSFCHPFSVHWMDWRDIFHFAQRTFVDSLFLVISVPFWAFFLNSRTYIIHLIVNYQVDEVIYFCDVNSYGYFCLRTDSFDFGLSSILVQSQCKPVMTMVWLAVEPIWNHWSSLLQATSIRYDALPDFYTLLLLVLNKLNIF